MKLSVSLSEESISSAIEQLRILEGEIKLCAKHTVEILANEGAEKAQSSYRDWSVVVIPDIVNDELAEITVAGDYPAMAEFGAGDGTLTGGFENVPGEVRPGSYSEQHAQQYSRWGFWYFAGEPYTEVPAHHGLLDAKRYIIEHSTEVAKGAFNG